MSDATADSGQKIKKFLNPMGKQKCLKIICPESPYSGDILALNELWIKISYFNSNGMVKRSFPVHTQVRVPAVSDIPSLQLCSTPIPISFLHMLHEKAALTSPVAPCSAKKTTSLHNKHEQTQLKLQESPHCSEWVCQNQEEEAQARQ